jgi:hypothetical protein
LPSLDNDGLDSSTLTLRITTSTGSVATLLLYVAGRFTTQNKALVEVLDQFIMQNFSAPLEAEGGELPLIANATLTGGFLYLLCSSRGATELVQTFRDGIGVGNECFEYNLEAHFRYFLICRLRELVDGLLGAIRFEDPFGAYSSWCSHAYAAAVISHCEISHFRSSLRNGHLRNCVRWRSVLILIREANMSSWTRI